MTTRSYSNNFEIVDQTASLIKLPQTWSILNDSGLFVQEPITTPTATFQEINGTLGIVGDQVRGTKPQTQLNDARKIHSYSCTFHAMEDALFPSDLAGKSSYSDLNAADTEAAALLRKLEKMRKSFAVTREVARFKTLGTGAVWSPNATVSGNFYTDFGITRKEVDFALGTATTDVVAKCEEIIASFQASANDGVVITEVIAYCSPAFFGKLIAHAKVQAAYTYYTATEGQQILRNRAGGAGLYRRFSYAGITFIEVATVLAGQTLVTSGDAIFVAKADDAGFVTYTAPPNRFGYENTFGEFEYAWTFRDPRQTQITVEMEMSMLNVLKRPNFVARGYTA